MTASVRSYFRENALESTDAVLFSIPKANEVGMMEGMEQHPALMNFVYAVEGEGTGAGGGGLGVSILSGRAMKWLLVGYVVAGFFVVEFVGELRCLFC